MPVRQAAAAGLEVAINRLLLNQGESISKLAQLNGKTCSVWVIELGFLIRFSFTAKQILVSMPDESFEDACKDSYDANSESCSIKVSLFVLNELTNINAFTKLIKQDKLDFKGNLTIAHTLSEIFKSIQFDAEEILSNYVGDIAAHSLVHNIEVLKNKSIAEFKTTLQQLSDVAFDEKPVAIRKIMVTNFSDEVNEIRQATDRLEAKIMRLEALEQAPKEESRA